MCYVGMLLQIERDGHVLARDWFLYNIQEDDELYMCTARLLDNQFYVVFDDYIQDNSMSICRRSELMDTEFYRGVEDRHCETTTESQHRDAC